MILYGPDSKASKGQKEKEDDDDDRNGDIAFDHDY